MTEVQGALRQLIPGRVALFHSDPAAAKVCLGLERLLRAEDPSASASLYSNRIHGFESEFSLQVECLAGDPEPRCFDAVDTIFTGTSHPDSSGGFELKAIDWGQRLGLRTISFVDHWVSFRLRFLLGGRLLLPDRVLVIDERAAELARADGLPADRLGIMPNPYLTFLSRLWRPRRSGADIRRSAGIPHSARAVILYVPDPISLRGEGRLRRFTEATATADLIDCVSRLPPDVAVLVKLHPLQPPGVLEPLLESSSRLRLVDADHVTLPELMHVADLVVGFYSNALLEAHALGRPVVRYYPGDMATEPLGHLSFGTRVGSPDALLATLRAVVEGTVPTE